MKTALIVDDSEYMRLLVKVKLGPHGFTEFYEAENGVEGVEKYKEFKPDIVFMDIMMEEMSGLDALKQIIAYDSTAKVIVFSSIMKQQYHIEDAMANGAKAVIQKPLDDTEIAKALESIF